MKEDTMFWVEDTEEQFPFPVKRKRRNRERKLEFIGWGSRPLIEFLDSIGKSASKQLTQHEVAAIINQYVNANNLLNPQKKKKVLCDDRLHTLFGKKSVPRMKIYDLLEVHFAENHDESEEEEYSSEEEDDVTASYKEKKVKTSGRKVSHEKKNDEAPKSCFAAINPENIKLVYLKRSLVQELLKIPESFEEKIKGSFVRVKSDPNDYLQKHSHQLQQVTGMRKTYEADNDGTEFQLRVTNSVTDISLRMLSDDNFSEEECEDLRERVKAGLIERPTIVELEAKAKILHQDIMKHWIVREIILLQTLINRANEKGWRRELYEYMEKKKLLQTDSEQERLLLEMPKVIADELEPQPTSIDTSIRADENSCSPTSILRGASDICSADAADSQDVPVVRSQVRGMVDAHETPKQVEEIEDQPVQQDIELPAVSVYENKGEEREDKDSGERRNSRGMPESRVIPSQVIELSDDEGEVENPEKGTQNTDGDLDAMWHYLDPQGEIQGPFTIFALKRWSDMNYFSPSFMVWKAGESHEKAVLLFDVIRRAFPAA